MIFASAIYVLCALTSFGCTFLLITSHRKARSPLLLWSAVCFATMTLSCILLFVDLVLVPQVDLTDLRLGLNLIASASLTVGLIWNSN